MKKVLIITYYWPPINSAGVYRWLKFAKYLREFGWEPTIYTIDRKNVGPDHSLVKDIPAGITVLTKPIFDPFDVYQAFLGKNKKNSQPGFLKEKEGSNSFRKLLFWVRGNFFIPDAKKFWVRPSIRFLSKYIEDHKIDVVVSTGPPHSMHLIGMGVKKRTGVKWLADFRDPWTNIDFYERLGLSKLADKKHRMLEAQVIATADEIVTVSSAWAHQFEQDHGRHVTLVTNGYDEEDFAGVVPEMSEFFTIVQTGSMNEDRDPKALWRALVKFFDENEGARTRVRVKLIGPVDHDVASAYKQAGLEDIVEQYDLMDHKKAIREMVNATMLLLPINDAKNMAGIIPGKLYEYLRSGRPILCIGAPDGDCARIILEARAGTVHAHEDDVGVLSVLNYHYQQFTTGCVPSNTKCSNKYERKQLTGQIAEAMNNALANVPVQGD